MDRSASYRLAVLILLAALAVAATYFLFATETGRHLRDNHKRDHERAEVHRWVHSHEAVARASLVAVFVVLTIVILPVWWVQVLAGYCLGFYWGLLWCQIGATVGAIIAHQVSRWLLAHWIHQKLEAKMAKVRALDEKLGHNGLLVVMITRLTHVAPFGLSNYFFGITHISAIDVTVGTLLGGIPATALYVMIGADPHRLKDWRFVSSLVAVNLVLLIPLILRYLRPEWFRKIGVE